LKGHPLQPHTFSYPFGAPEKPETVWGDSVVILQVDRCQPVQQIGETTSDRMKAGWLTCGWLQCQTRCRHAGTLVAEEHWWCWAPAAPSVWRPPDCWRSPTQQRH